jgi:hypothetical protein
VPVRALPSAERIFILGIFANGSTLNHFGANCLKKR